MRQLIRQKPYHGVMIGLQKVPVTRSVQVCGVGKLTAEFLALYFENLDEVEDADVKLVSEADCAVVRFTDSSGNGILVRFIH